MRTGITIFNYVLQKHDYKVRQIITSHLDISIMQTVQVYEKSVSFTHTEKRDPPGTKIQYDVSDMEQCFPTTN